MPKITDNPLRLERLVRGNVGQTELARRTGVMRSTILAIEDGRTRDPSPQTVASIEHALGMVSGTLGPKLAAWHEARKSRPPELPAKARAILKLPPHQIPDAFDSFVAWREAVAGSSFAMAGVLGVNHSTLNAYERGVRHRPGMPPVLASAMMDRLGVSIEYVIALQNLEPDTEEE